MRFNWKDALAAVVCVGLLAGMATADDKDGKKKKGDEDNKKPVIIQLDASKLSPDLLKKLIEAAGGKTEGDKKPGDNKPQQGVKKPGDGNKKPGDGDKKPEQRGKSLGLAEAIGIAEKHTQGVAIKAEYDDKGFAVSIKGNKGVMTVHVDSSGQVIGDKGTKKGEESEKPNKKKVK